MRITDTALLSRLDRAEKTLARVARNAVNDAATIARDLTPDYLRQHIDRPTPFTVNRSVARVARATSDAPVATLFIAPTQARYLAHMEDGTPSERIHQPVLKKVSTDRFGNIKKNFILNRGNIERMNAGSGDFFFGKPKGAMNRPLGIYWRDEGMLDMITIVKATRENKPQLGLGEYWEGILPDLARAEAQKQLDHPANAL